MSDDRDLDPLADRDVWVDDAAEVEAWHLFASRVFDHPGLYLLKQNPTELGALLFGFALGRKTSDAGVYDGFRRWMGRRHPWTRNRVASANVEYELSVRLPDASELDKTREYIRLLLEYLRECQEPKIRGLAPPLLLGGLMALVVEDDDPWQQTVDQLRAEAICNFDNDRDPVSVYVIFELPWDDNDKSRRGPTEAAISQVWDGTHIQVSCRLPSAPSTNPRTELIDHLAVAATLAEQHSGSALPNLRAAIDLLQSQKA